MKYAGMVLTEETVTPAVAERWLGLNNVNRRLRPERVNQYARDMLKGNWYPKPVPICFDEEGRLGNGQHTLYAIKQSGVAQCLLVARHVSHRSIAVMDAGLVRSVNDIARFVGADFENRKATVAKIIEYGTNNNKEPAGFYDLLEIYQQHADVIDFAVANAPKAPGFSAPTLAVIARAAYSHDRERLAAFKNVVRSGEITDAGDTAAIRLRDFARSLNTSSGWAARAEIYEKAQTAVACFLARKPLAKLYRATTEQFPLPTK